MSWKSVVTGLGTTAALSAALLAGASPALATDSVPNQALVGTQLDEVEVGAAFAANLPASERAKWEALSVEQQAEVVAVLSDPRIDTITTNSEAKEISPILGYEATAPSAVSSAPGSERAVGTMATTRRSGWTEGYWTILGIRYASVRTSVDYNTSGGSVVSHNACYGGYTNYVPLRTIQGNSYTIYGNGKLTCETAWSIARPLQATQYGYQGIRVNGYGTIEATWNP